MAHLGGSSLSVLYLEYIDCRTHPAASVLNFIVESNVDIFLGKYCDI